VEHRWGRRIRVRVAVRLIAETGEPVLGHIDDVSISGAFVSTARSVPLWVRLEVEFARPGELGRELERVAAQVTRRTRDGVGIEWCELAPRAVRALLPRMAPLAARSGRPEMPGAVRPVPEPQAVAPPLLGTFADG
jgi:hypothetical protein